MTAITENFANGRYDLVADQIDDNKTEAAAANNALPTKLTNTPTATSPARSHDTIYQGDPDATTEVTFSLSCTNATVELFVGPTSPPEVSEGKTGVTVLSGLVSVQCWGQLHAWIPPGYFYQLVTAGAGTATLDSTRELIYR